MKHLRRLVGLTITALVLLAALSPNAALPTYAQNTNTVTIEGSAIVSPILKAASQSYTAKHADTKIDVNPTGTDAGFEKLCSGSLDAAMAARSISDTEIAACKSKNVQFIETLLGYDALVVVVNTTSKATCVIADGVNRLLGPGSDVKNWSALDASFGDAPIGAIYSTAATAQAYVLADTLVPGDKLRGDIQFLDTPKAVADKIGAEANSIGIMTLADYQSQNLGVTTQTARAVQLKTDAAGACITPDVPALEEARYPEAESLYLYVNAASLDRAPAADFLKYLVSSDGRTPVASLNFVQASDTTYDRDLNYLNTRQGGRTFSLVQTVTANFSPDTAGTVTLGGAAESYPVMKAISDAFSPRYSKITVTTGTFGNDAGLRDLCAGAVDLVGTSRLPTDAEKAVCQKANIQTLQVTLGMQGVVVVVNAKSKVDCLTTDQLAKVLGADSQGKVKKWSDVSADFPATDLLVLTPSDGSPETDFLMSKIVKGVAPLLRQDVTQNDDPLYRAAAVQNVDGGITYMTYNEFQQVKSSVHLVGIQAGSACVKPADDTVKNGTYPLSYPLYATLNVNAFNRPEVQAFSWFFLSDDVVAVLAKQGLIGTNTADFVAARDIALARFAQVKAQGTPSATQAATGAATGVATAGAPAATAVPAATNAATPPATPPATSAATAVATTAPAAAPVATTAPTAAATTAPTTVPTAAATAAVTAATTAAATTPAQ